MEDCVFCKIVKGELPSEKVLENHDFIVIKPLDPLVMGHSLVIPREHYKTFSDMPADLYDGLLKTAKEAIDKLDTKNYNLVINSGKDSGQEIPHVHLHILPRKKNDDFKLRV